jgi:hypothetical protein
MRLTSHSSFFLPSIYHRPFIMAMMIDDDAESVGALGRGSTRTMTLAGQDHLRKFVPGGGTTGLLLNRRMNRCLVRLGTAKSGMFYDGSVHCSSWGCESNKQTRLVAAKSPSAESSRRFPPMDRSTALINQSCWPLLTTSWRYEPTSPLGLAHSLVAPWW